MTGGRTRKSILSDALEAVIGAIYLDGGFASAKEFISKYILTDTEHKQLFYDSKTILQEEVQGSDKGSLITVGGHDARITRSGYFIRKYKLDELPQLINVFLGDMSLVGPRPEVRRYVDLYTEEQRRVLNVRPGITDPASIKYRNENELLEGAEDPERYYIEVIMPDKLRLNIAYATNQSLLGDLRLICETFKAIVEK